MGAQTLIDGSTISFLEETAAELLGKEHFLVERGATAGTVKLLVTPGNEIGTVYAYDNIGGAVTVRLLGAPGSAIFVQSGAIAHLGAFKGAVGGKVTAAAVGEAAIGIKTSPASNGAANDHINGLLQSPARGAGLASVAVTVANAGVPNGNAAITLQAKDPSGRNLAGRCLLRVWLAASANVAPADLGTLTATTGVLLKEDTDDALATVLTDATGLAVLALDTISNGDVHAHAAIVGLVGTGNAAITGN